jgi:large subunit ribosomal protein L23
MKNPYEIIKARYITEKATVLEQLHTANSNRSLAKCSAPKYVFLVDTSAGKAEIAAAVEEIYREKKIKVSKVNTIIIKSKPKRRGRGRPGKTATFKKAVVTLETGDTIDNV